MVNFTGITSYLKELAPYHQETKRSTSLANVAYNVVTGIRDGVFSIATAARKRESSDEAYACASGLGTVLNLLPLSYTLASLIVSESFLIQEEWAVGYLGTGTLTNLDSLRHELKRKHSLETITQNAN